MNDENSFVFVVDDDRSVRESLRNLIRSAGLNVQTFDSAQEFLTSQRPGAPNCLVLDVQMPGLSGLDLQQELARDLSQIPIIFITGHVDIPMTVRAMKAGAVDFLIKPFSEEALLNSVRLALASRGEETLRLNWYGTATEIESRKQEEERVRKENVCLETRTRIALKERPQRENIASLDEVDRASIFEKIVGTSKALKDVLSRIANVAPTNSTVFITGESGTGKELIARAVYKRSQRSGHAFVGVNCAALAPSLISSELFGHEKGAFTGATQRRLGRFELANGGTIFLDEVGELMPDTQAALLRVLQEREFERVGGERPVQVDVRVIAATNRDLKAAVANGRFREDLFYRLNVFPIDVPPLRKRKDDILMLVEYFVQRYASRAGRNIRSIDKKTLGLLQAYDWPGNIRELQNVIERSVILSSGDVFSADELWFSKETSLPASRVAISEAFKDEAKPHSELEIIKAALSESRGRVSGPSGAAGRLGLSPSTLEDRIKVLKIDKWLFKYS